MQKEQLPDDTVVVVGFSGGVTSAWCAHWAIETFGREKVTLLFHDTFEEHPDTYRFLVEMSKHLGIEITERSDGRSVTQVFRDEGFLGNNYQAMCSRILKQNQGDKHLRELQAQGKKVIKVFGYTANEERRVQRMTATGEALGFTPRFPLIENGITKQQTADWVVSTGVCPSAMYQRSDHANCTGCVKGGRTYWLAVLQNHPDVFEQRAQLEEEFGHSIIRGPNPTFLRPLAQLGMKRPHKSKEAIEVASCQCGD
jgi:hypothetical protein